MKVLLTGGAGYIGSHTAVELIDAGHEVVIVDDLSNSNENVLERLEKITGKKIDFYKVDVANEAMLDEIFLAHKIDSVIHFAGYKAVGESVKKPLEYYENNIGTTLNLIRVMKKHNVKNLVFSSSATVYGTPKEVPLKEEMDTWCTNPYGWTKFMNERILMDISNAEPDMAIILLRYFNPIGAHSSGLIGENPNGIPNNLMPYISQVAVGKLKELSVFGNDYDTKDGTGVRDYIHVVDLAKGHVKAIEFAEKNTGVEIFNLGTGTGYSVLELVEAFKTVNHVEVPYKIVERRPGDIATCFADSTKAKRMLGWEAQMNLEDMCKDSWKWQVNNPEGY
ncbi:MAG: UDP-glucose 4-epimerase GalE [Clostridia bacterium]|nr:UDP-glucose 4-epimerase GalE [Clostridia bacterium]